MKIVPFNFCKFIENSINMVQRINPVIRETDGRLLELPRFSSPEMQQARVMNLFSKKDLYKEFSFKIPPKAKDSDLERLFSTNVYDTQRRAVWIDTKTGKRYHFLKENNENDIHELRVLSEDGEFVKNIVVKPNNIILCDLSEGDKVNTNILGMDFNHSDLMSTIAIGYNPFSDYTICKINRDEELLELIKELPANTSCVEFSYGIFRKADNKKSGKEIEKELIREYSKLSQSDTNYLVNMQNLSDKVRTFACAGNSADELNTLLFKTGIEGVGGLNPKGNVDVLSGSRNSYFTQHYEPFVFPIVTTKEGVNISGMNGTDIDMPHDLPIGQYLGRIRGTSFSAPVRAAKVALDDMLSKKMA